MIPSIVEQALLLGIRALELILGITCDDSLAGFLTDSIALPAFQAAIPIIAKLSLKYGISPHNHFNVEDLVDDSGALSVGYLGDLPGRGRQKHCLSTQYIYKCMLGDPVTDPAIIGS